MAGPSGFWGACVRSLRGRLDRWWRAGRWGFGLDLWRRGWCGAGTWRGAGADWPAAGTADAFHLGPGYWCTTPVSLATTRATGCVLLPWIAR